jgi:UDP-glucuronate decarboxylase
MEKKILVSGGAGFIGSQLCKKLLEQNHRVICVDNLFSGFEKNINNLKINNNFKFILHDICKPLIIEDNIDEIFHLACPASPVAYQKDPLFTLRTCFQGTYNMCELAKEKNAKILFTSTSEIYGDPLVHPQAETYYGNVNTIGIRSCYDEGKRIGETILTEFHNNHNINIQIARIFNTYGPNMSPSDGRVVTNFIRQYLRNEPITIYGEGKQTRSLCYIDDTINGLIKLMKKKEYIGPTNIGNPNEQTIIEIAQTIKKYIPETKSTYSYQPLPQDDPLSRKPDISKAQEKINWKPEVSLKFGIENTIAFIKKEIQ